MEEMMPSDNNVIDDNDANTIDANDTTAATRYAGRVVVVSGPPACGKGTQCKLVAQKLGLVHVSTGDVFRAAVAQGTELGVQAKEYLDRGAFVPDEMVITFIKTRIQQPDVGARGCLLDGFPRTSSQAEALAREVDVALFLVIQVPDQALVQRAASRRIDPETGEIYHLEYRPPPPERLPSLVRREHDDDPATFKIRLATFHELIRRIAPSFPGKVRALDGMRSVEEVFADVERALAEAEAPPASPANEGSAQRCAICLTAPADFLCGPCGHQCGCETCLNAVASSTGRCPICRATIASVTRVFLSGVSDGSEPAVPAVPAAAAAAPRRARASDEVSPLLEPLQLDGPPGAPSSLAADADAWPEDAEAWPADEQEQSASAPRAPADEEPPAAGVSLEIAPARPVGVDGGEVPVVVRVSVEECPHARPPVDLCCVVDISGSMGQAASYEDEDGRVTNDGLVILDVVKHAVKTVAHILQADDRMSLVVFDDVAERVFPLQKMTEAGRADYIAALEGLRPRGATNLWAGLREGLEALREPPGGALEPRAKTLMLLTDGMPNRKPPRGHVEELRSYRDQFAEHHVQINTFGFGYTLDSELLLSLAVEGGGAYAFIPDALIVGTVFVNAVASVLTTATQDAILHLTPAGGAAFAGPVLGGFAATDESWGRMVALGPLQWGQPREVAVPLRLPAGDAASGPYLEAVVEFHSPSGAVRVQGAGDARSPSAGASLCALRCEAVGTGFGAVASASEGRGNAAQRSVAELAEKLSGELRNATTGENNAALVALHADVSGRMSKALTGKQRFDRWGRHYIRALMRSHQLQQCSNFMDAGLQHFGGTLFKSLRQRGDAIFLELPPPTPAPSQRDARASQGRTPSAATPHYATPRNTAPRAGVDMRTYYAGAQGGCFDGGATVLVAASEHGGFEGRELRGLTAGEWVRCADGSAALVRCVAKIARAQAKPLVALPCGPALTPRHPVRIDGEWMRPADAEGARLVGHDGWVYNLILAPSRALRVSGVETVMWGHQLDGDVVGHPFFGTSRVVECIGAMAGWAAGHVEIGGCVRDAASGEVVGLRECGAALGATTQGDVSAAA